MIGNDHDDRCLSNHLHITIKYVRDLIKIRQKYATNRLYYFICSDETEPIDTYTICIDFNNNVPPPPNITFQYCKIGIK